MDIRVLVLLIFLSASVPAYSQFRADVTITSIENRDVSRKMRESITKTIDEINAAFRDNRTPQNPDRGLINDAAFNNIQSLWEVSTFRVTQTQLVLDGLHLQKGGYQVRNIPVYFIKESDDSKEREIGFNFDAAGNLTDCFLCLENNTYNSLLYHGNNVTEVKRRQIILDFIENFRTAYNTKDLERIQQVFSEHALIIVGKVIKTAGTTTGESARYTNIPVEKVKYIRLSKNEYITNLSRAFRANEYLKIEFDSAEIVQSRQYPDLYGVTLRQAWKSTNYSDIGWIFLMIDFRDADRPMIHVRTWQPAVLNGQPLSKDEVFKIGDFDPGRD